MRPWRSFRDCGSVDGADDPERGSAAIEFIVAGLILLVPLVYLIVAMASIQAGSFAVEGAARQAARVYVRSADPAAAHAAAANAVKFALADYGLRSAQANVHITCRPRPQDCLRRRGFVTVRVDATVPLPLSPPAMGGRAAASAPVEATATQQVSRFSELDADR